MTNPPPHPQVQYSPDGQWWWNGSAWLPVQPPVGYGPPPGWMPYQSQPFAGFWIRFLAYLIDALPINAVAVPINLVLFGNSGVICGATPYSVTTSGAVSGGGTNYSCNATGNGTLIFLALGLAYFVFMWSRGATLGQRVVGIRVADANTGSPLTIGQSLLRYVGFCIASIPLALGLIWAGWDARKQGWHDKMATSVVLKRTAS